MISTRFTLEELEYIRQHGVLVDSGDFGDMCKCGQLKLIVGARLYGDFTYCLYTHGELLFKLGNLDEPEHKRREALGNLLECCDA